MSDNETPEYRKSQEHYESASSQELANAIEDLAHYLVGLADAVDSLPTSSNRKSGREGSAYHKDTALPAFIEAARRIRTKG